MIYQDVCEHFGMAENNKLEDLIPQPERPILALKPDATVQQVMAAACSSVYPLMEDDARMRQGEDFDVLRKNYPVRREFSSLQLQGITNTECLAMMHGLGFGIEDETH